MAGWDWPSRVDLEVCSIGFGSLNYFHCFSFILTYMCYPYVVYERSLFKFMSYAPRLVRRVNLFCKIHHSTVTHNSATLYCQGRLYPVEKRQILDKSYKSFIQLKLSIFCLDLNWKWNKVLKGWNPVIFKQSCSENKKGSPILSWTLVSFCDSKVLLK